MTIRISGIGQRGQGLLLSREGKLIRPAKRSVADTAIEGMARCFYLYPKKLLEALDNLPAVKQSGSRLARNYLDTTYTNIFSYSFSGTSLNSPYSDSLLKSASEVFRGEENLARVDRAQIGNTLAIRRYYDGADWLPDVDHNVLGRDFWINQEKVKTVFASLASIAGHNYNKLFMPGENITGTDTDDVSVAAEKYLMEALYDTNMKFRRSGPFLGFTDKDLTDTALKIVEKYESAGNRLTNYEHNLNALRELQYKLSDSEKGWGVIRDGCHNNPNFDTLPFEVKAKCGIVLLSAYAAYQAKTSSYEDPIQAVVKNVFPDLLEKVDLRIASNSAFETFLSFDAGSIELVSARNIFADTLASNSVEGLSEDEAKLLFDSNLISYVAENIDAEAAIGVAYKLYDDSSETDLSQVAEIALDVVDMFELYNHHLTHEAHFANAVNLFREKLYEAGIEESFMRDSLTILAASAAYGVGERCVMDIEHLTASADSPAELPLATVVSIHPSEAAQMPS